MIPQVPISIVLDPKPAVSYPPLWMHKEDVESGVFLSQNGTPRLRTCAYTGGCPAVFVLRSPLLKVVLDMHWQFFLGGINYLMSPADVAKEMHYHLAFLNNTGLGKPGVPRRNYLEGKDLTAQEYPRFDKDRTCSRSKMTGTEAYSLTTAISQTFQTARETLLQRKSLAPLRQSMREMLTTNNVLKALTLDGEKPPPLKPGKTYPQRVQDIRPNDYLYTPWSHPWLFFAANTVSSTLGGGSKIFPFPRGAVYPWMDDGWKYTWFPHVARGEIKYPLTRLQRLTPAPGARIPSAYRSI